MEEQLEYYKSKYLETHQVIDNLENELKEKEQELERQKQIESELNFLNQEQEKYYIQQQQFHQKQTNEMFSFHQTQRNSAQYYQIQRQQEQIQNLKNELKQTTQKYKNIEDEKKQLYSENLKIQEQYKQQQEDIKEQEKQQKLKQFINDNSNLDSMQDNIIMSNTNNNTGINYSSYNSRNDSFQSSSYNNYQNYNQNNQNNTTNINTTGIMMSAIDGDNNIDNASFISETIIKKHFSNEQKIEQLESQMTELQEQLEISDSNLQQEKDQLGEIIQILEENIETFKFQNRKVKNEKLIEVFQELKHLDLQLVLSHDKKHLKFFINDDFIMSLQIDGLQLKNLQQQQQYPQSEQEFSKQSYLPEDQHTPKHQNLQQQYEEQEEQEAEEEENQKEFQEMLRKSIMKKKCELNLNFLQQNQNRQSDQTLLSKNDSFCHNPQQDSQNYIRQSSQMFKSTNNSNNTSQNQIKIKKKQQSLSPMGSQSAQNTYRNFKTQNFAKKKPKPQDNSSSRNNTISNNHSRKSRNSLDLSDQLTKFVKIKNPTRLQYQIQQKQPKQQQDMAIQCENLEEIDLKALKKEKNRSCQCQIQ